MHQFEATRLEGKLWMTTGRNEFNRHQHPSSHRRVSLATVVRLVDIATQLGCLTSGLDLKTSEAEKPIEECLDY